MFLNLNSKITVVSSLYLNHYLRTSDFDIIKAYYTSMNGSVYFTRNYPNGTSRIKIADYTTCGLRRVHSRPLASRQRQKQTKPSACTLGKYLSIDQHHVFLHLVILLESSSLFQVPSF